MAMDNDLYYMLIRTPPQEEVCTDENYVYYKIRLLGLALVYRVNRWRSDGQRMYLFSDSFARLLGYPSLDYMKRGCRLQWWRGAITPRSLKKRLSKVGGNWCP